MADWLVIYRVYSNNLGTGFARIAGRSRDTEKRSKVCTTEGSTFGAAEIASFKADLNLSMYETAYVMDVQPLPFVAMVDNEPETR